MQTTLTDYIDLQHDIALAIEDWHRAPDDTKLKGGVSAVLDVYLRKQRRVKELLHMGANDRDAANAI